MNRQIDKTLVAYRNGLNADILQAQINGEWGPIWTIPPCSPNFMERAGRQFTQSRAQAVRHTRRALLRRPLASSEPLDVVVVTELPSGEQHVTSFDGMTLRVTAYLEDESLASLTASFSPSLHP